MIICCRCKKEKSVTYFNFKNKDLGIRAKACKECTRLEIRNHYYRNHEYYLSKANIRNRTTRINNSIFIWKYLSNHPCVDCGEADPAVLEFDHLGIKIDSIAQMKRTNSLKSLIKEIEKCQVRCANCHRRKTALQFGWNKFKL